MRSCLLLFVIALMSSTAANAADEVALVSASLGDAMALVRLLSGQGEWRAEGGQFARLDIRFEKPVEISRLEIEACSGGFTDGVDAYVNFDHTRVFVEGGKNKLTFAIAGEGKPLPVTSLVFNFRHNRDVCVRSLGVFRKDMRVQLKVPERVEVAGGRVPAALFDARPETYWSHENSGAVEMKLAAETEISRVRVWNGDQRGPSRFKAAPRAKVILFASESGSERVSLADRDGPQIIRFKTPFKSRALRLSVEEASGGAVSKARVAEIQLGDDTRFFAPNVTGALQALADARRSGFRAGNLGNMMDQTLDYHDDETRWAVRVRSDGTVFIKGHSESLDRARVFSFLGLYTILEANATRVRLQVEGSRFTTHAELDGTACPGACSAGGNSSEQVVNDEISFGRSRDGLVFVRDEGPRRASGLDFRSFKARVLTSAE